ncbi:MAG: hypothetical protein AAF125_25925, partial [Chloroflexota bacterium]
MSKRNVLYLIIVGLLVSVAPIGAQDGPAIALFSPLGNNDYVLATENGVSEVVEAAGGSVVI